MYAGGSLPLRRPASAVRMAGKRSSSFNLARLVDDGPYPVECSEHNADLVRTFPLDLPRLLVVVLMIVISNSMIVTIIAVIVVQS